MTRQRHNDETGRTPQELRDERLSAFLDSELTPEEHAAVEAELAADAAMRAELDELRRVQQMLASLGEVRAPRPFTLEAPPARASMARRLTIGRLEWAMRVGTAVAGIAFLVAIAAPAGGGSMLTPGGGGDDAAMETMSTLAVPETAAGGAEAFRAEESGAPVTDGDAQAGAASAPAAGEDASGGGSEGPPGTADGSGALQAPDDPAGTNPAPAEAPAAEPPSAEFGGQALPVPVDEGDMPVSQTGGSGGPGGVELSLLVLTLLLAALSSLPVIQRRRQE